MSKTVPIKLFTFLGFSAPWRPAIALKLKKIEYTPIVIDLSKKQQREENYTKINPNQIVPSLQYGDQMIYESMAIVQFLEDIQPTPNLLPKDPYNRSQIRAICETVNSGIHPYHASRYYDWLISMGVNNIDKKDVSKQMLTRGFKALDKQLELTHGKYSFGDTITMADLFVYPTIYGADVSYHVNVNDYPHIKHVTDNLKDLPEFQFEKSN